MAVRLIAGTLGRRKIEVPDTLGLRPTTDRVRETLFNWLQSEIVGSACLDLFAGSGALGLEAYSRGASLVVNVELDEKAYKVLLKRSVEWSLKPSYSVIKANALHWLTQYKGAGFDIIFLDPPFQLACLDEVIHLIQAQGSLKPSGYLYIEKAHQQKIAKQIDVVKERKAGMLTYGLYRLTH